jgi:transcriptional regulator with XRE-family HTH domain
LQDAENIAKCDVKGSHMLSDSSTKPTPDHRQYVRSIIAKSGWNQTELARRAGIDPSTLSRFLASTSAGLLRPSTIQRLEHVSGLSVDGKELSDSASGFAESDAVPLPAPSDERLKNAIAALTCGRGPVDAWTLKSRSVEQAGYRSGDILLVRLGETALTGDLVCAQVFDWARSKAETVFRIFAPPFLVAATPDPGLYPPHDTSNDKVLIKGVVIASIRMREAAP